MNPLKIKTDDKKGNCIYTFFLNIIIIFFQVFYLRDCEKNGGGGAVWGGGVKDKIVSLLKRNTTRKNR